jgi:hypothetical protein
VSTPVDPLQAVLDEQAIRRNILSYARGMDRLDFELVRDCYWPEAVDVHGPFRGRRDEFVEWVEGRMRRHTLTMHLFANILVELDGDAAGAETYGVAHHAGEPAADRSLNFTCGLRYVDRFERRGQEWRILDRLCLIEWYAPWDSDRERGALTAGASRRDRDDPAYAFHREHSG